MKADKACIDVAEGVLVATAPKSNSAHNAINAAVADVQAGDYSFGKHRPRSSRVIRPS